MPDRRRTPANSRRGRRRRLALVGALALAAAAVVIAAVARGGDEGGDATRDRQNDQEKGPAFIVGDRDGSTIEDGAPAIEMVRSPATYRIVYRVELDDVVNTDRVWVRRPFDSRVETWSGAPPGATQTSSQVATFGRRSSTTGDQPPSTIGLPPGPPTSDLRMSAGVEFALANDLVERRERRRVGDRLCQVYRSSAPLGATAASRAVDDTALADTCIDEAGLVLEEVIVAEGEVLLRRLAVEVEEDATVDPALFPDLPTTLDVRQGGGLVRRLVPGSTAPGPFLVLPTPPEGFTLLGRFSVIPPQPENFDRNDPTREGFRRAGVVDVWTRGADVIVLDQGGTLRGEAPFDIDAANPTIDIGALGKAEVVVSGQGVELRALRSDGRYVRVAGTATPAELAAIARALQEIEGSELQFAE